MKAGELIECQIIGFQDYGIFVKHQEYEGLIHISQISEKYVTNLNDLFVMGESLLVLVLDVDHENKRLKLSYKQAHPIGNKILKEIPIIKGFQTLKNNLSDWIDKEGKK